MAWATLVRAEQVLVEQVEADLKAADLPPLSWYDVLIEVYWAKGEPLRQFEIAERCLISKYNLSRLLDRLEDEGLLTRSACKQDKRGANISITAEGKALLRKMWPVYASTLERHFARHFSAPELKQLTALLRRVIPETKRPTKPAR